MTDKIDFRVNDRLAIGHDALNTIIFVKGGNKPQNGRPWFDGVAWRQRMFIYRDKSALVMHLRELGVASPLNLPEIAELPEDLREWRKGEDASVGTVSAGWAD